MDNLMKTKVKIRHNALLELCNEASALKNKSKEEGVTLHEITEIHIRLVAATSNFERDFLKLVECNPDMEVREQEIYITDQMKAEQLSQEMEAIKQIYKQNTSTEPQIASSTKLPKLEIPKFNGDILKWPEFWDKFDSSIHSRNINKVDKLSYLFSAMEGKALDALRGIDITNSNYDIAIETLRSRFGDKTLVIDAHYEALNKLPRATDQSTRSTLDAIIKHLRILDSLGENTKGNYLRGLVCSKFPDRVIYELNLLTTVDRDIDTIIRTLEKIITAKERSMPSCDIPSGSTHHTTEVLHVREERPSKRKFKPKNLDVPYRKRDRIECAFCHEPHYSDQCSKYKNYEERKKQLKNKCFKCLKTGHAFKQCRDRTPCRHCNGKHNRAMCRFNINKHLQRRNKRPESGREEPGKGNHDQGKEASKNILDAEYILYLQSNITSYLQTATVRIISKTGDVPARILLDSGSQRSYITSNLAAKLHIVPDSEDKLVIFTFGSEVPTETISPSTDITLITKRGTQRTIRVNIVPHITDRIQISQLQTSDIIDVSADDNGLGEGIDLLIGNDYYYSFLKENHFKVNDNLYLVDTEFGWTISGRRDEQGGNDLSIITYCQCHGKECPYFTEPDPPLRNIDFKFLWSLESIGIVDSPKATREDEAIKHFNRTVKYEDGRYQVKWPWIDFPPQLPTNFGLAFGRLKGLLKRADKATISDYEDILREQLQSGIIEEVEPETIPIYSVNHPVHYLPHHIVKQNGKKGRIVYDASSKTKEQKSLNECMYRGPSMLEDLTALLLKFRTGRVGISADVEKAFLQVGLQREDRDVTRFLWVKNTGKDATEDNRKYYRFCRVPFGVISSPFLLTATIRHHLACTDQTLLKKIADRTYVDNLVTGASSSTEAYKLYKDTRGTFEALSMNIRDWISNDIEFMKRIPEEHRAKESETIKILGLIWNPQEDILKLRLPKFENSTPVTKKEVLRTLARLYDPCGFASPYILPAKLIFQQTCLLKLKWDSPLPPELQERWPTVLQDIETATEITIPRYVAVDMPIEVTYQLHCFTDASKNAYAAVVYLVAKKGDRVNTAFIMSKSRITPIDDKEDLKIPRLELLGYLIGNRLLKYVSENLELEIQEKHLWTDSMIVLSWMRTSKLLPPFVSRRVNEIKQQTDVNMRYVPTEINPADIATRPDAIKSQRELWFFGPEFLKKEKQNWPSQPGEQTLLSAGEALRIPEDPQMAGKGYEDISDIIEEIQLPEQITLPPQDGSNEIQQIKEEQAKHFPDEVAGKRTSLSRNLDLFLDSDGVLRCGGRLENAETSYETKHPILIPKLSEFTNQLIQNTHEENYHVGTSHTLSLIRKRFWIPQGRAQVQRVLKRCPRCIRHGGGPYKLPNTPALPTERVNFSTPFTYTAVDYFGPMFVETSVSKEKRWICLFTCLAVRAIHLELVNDLTAEECLLAVRRFVAGRGKPSLIVSDNATQFKLTSEVFMDPYCVKSGIRWKFIPQLAPWHGGVYERLIAVVKNCLKRTLDKHLLRDGQLMTVMKEVESVVNSRPLTTVTSEAEHILRPADFLSLGNCLELIPTGLAPAGGTTTKVDLLASWKRGRKILEEFKSMFRDRYLPSLRERYVQKPKQPRILSDRSPRVGDIVQIKDDARNRLNWRVGKISALLEGGDGKCRVAKVQVGKQEFTRSIAHLYPLEGDMEYLEEKPENICDSPQTNEEMMEVESPQIQEDRAVPCDAEPELVEVVEPDTELSTTPILNEDVDVEMPNAETSTDEDPTREVTGGATDDRVRRVAAVRAREKIAEWTRQLQLLALM